MAAATMIHARMFAHILGKEFIIELCSQRVWILLSGHQVREGEHCVGSFVTWAYKAVTRAVLRLMLPHKVHNISGAV